MIRCEDALRELWGYLCDEVTPESRARIAEHLVAQVAPQVAERVLAADHVPSRAVSRNRSCSRA